MQSNRWRAALILAFGLPLACSGSGQAGGGGASGLGGKGGAAAATGDGRLFVPEGLPASLQDGEVGETLKVVALTLADGPQGPEFYLAVRNDGSMPGCSAGVLADFVDQGGQTVASVGSALLGGQLYYYDQQDAIMNCLAPGQTGMSASRGFAGGLPFSEIAAVRYRFPRFEIDGIVPLAGIAVSALAPQVNGGGASYAGTLTNASRMAIRDPVITIFSTNRVGRPLGAATSTGTVTLAPGGTWPFVTDALTDAGADRVVYVTASLAN